MALVALAALGVAGWRWRGPTWRVAMTTFVLAALAGYCYAAWRAESRLADALAAEQEGGDLEVTGIIASLPNDDGDSVRFIFEVEEAASGVPGRLSLAWYRTYGFGRESQRARVPELRPGERWRLSTRLKRPHGSATPGGFDYEAWLLARGLRATGYVRDGQRLAENAGGLMGTVHSLRADVRQRFEAVLSGAPYRGVLVALAVGDQNAIDQPQWDILRRTGVQHLVAISGLHVSLVALACGGLLAAGWRRVPWLTLRCPVRRAAAMAGLMAAVIYALLAGLGIPVQRALVMLTVAALSLLGRREASARRTLGLALLVVVVIDPWAVLAAGFWLSFGAVAVILLVMGGRVVPPRGWRAALRLQLAISFATIPVLVALFQGFSLVAPLANAFAIPLVSFVIAPLTLLAVMIPVDGLLEFAHLMTEWMMAALQWLAASQLALHEQPLPAPWLIAAASLAAGILILPRGTPGRLAACAIIGAFFFWRPERPQEGGFRATVLDVGQGLAVHVQTAKHDLLYDTGPRYGRTSDAGERTVLPYLRAWGVERLDAVIISHDDADHAGGTSSVLAKIEVGHVVAGQDFAGAHHIDAVENCVAGGAWSWEGVRFELLAPVEVVSGRRGNDQSCVLRVSAADGAALLLMGDIERGGESALVARHGGALASTAVVAAHHGSKSSSSSAFVAAARPAVVIFSVGYRNRYGHPHPQILSRWTDAGAKSLRTDRDGTVLLETDRQGLGAMGWREKHPRYWHGR
ncbi:MAG: DNA internalization-related competence protein ComEC/Rec2 [Azoarcus sp.]|nr:DNA internalization-related competence protein ComEC/Rec2 [Azoarcus sp.]